MTTDNLATARIRYFASLREALGAGEEVAVLTGDTVASVRARLLASSPLHAQTLGQGRPVRVAVNQQLCEDATAVAPGDEVAFFPPVTGG